MYLTKKLQAIKYLKSLPDDIKFATDGKNWNKDDLIKEVLNDTEIGREIININFNFISLKKPR